MEKRVKKLVNRSALALEAFIAGLLCIGLLYFTFQLLGSTLHLTGFAIYDNFNDLLSTAFALVIGVEIIRMMCEHSLEIVFEMLTFAIARQIVIDHSHAIDNLYGVAAIAILFATKKYLFNEKAAELPTKKNKKQPVEDELSEPEEQKKKQGAL